MLEVVLWLIALSVALLGAAVLLAQCLLGMRSHAIVFFTALAAAAIVCLIGADAAEGWSGSTVEPGLLFKLALFLGIASSVCGLLAATRLFTGDRSVGWWCSALAVLMLVQLSLAGWSAVRFKDAQQHLMVVLNGDRGMENIPGKALLTDRGRLVPVFHVRDADSLHGDSEYAAGRFDDLRIERAGGDPGTNCHGWVFSGGKYLLMGSGVRMILEDNGYEAVEQPQAGDVIIYRDRSSSIVHTGLVRYADDEGLVLIESKWGIDARYVHRPEDQYYSQNFTYYRAPAAKRRQDPRTSHLVVDVSVLPGNVVVAEASGETLLVHRQPGDPPVSDSKGQLLPLDLEYPVGAE